jgi:hypothetical protein
VKPPKNVLRMNAQLPGLGTNDLGQALIRGQVRLSNLVDQSALKLHCVTLVRDRRLSLLIPSRPASFRFDILAHLPIIEFLALFSDLLVYAIEFELADHDHWVRVLELVEKGCVLLDDREDEGFGLGWDHGKLYGKLNSYNFIDFS